MAYNKSVYAKNDYKVIKEVIRNGWYKICSGSYGRKFDCNPFPTPDEFGSVRKRLLK